MKQSTRTILLAAALATPLVFGTQAARAQYQVNHGNANDANNLIGSGGANGGHSTAGNTGTQLGNLLITNDITGGRGFQGNVPYFAPGAFHGNTGTGSFDRFTANSSSATSNNAQAVKPYFSQGQYGNRPPQGFVADPKSPGLFTQDQPQARQSGDLREGLINNDPMTSALPRPGELALPGQVDPSNINAPLNVSNLTGNTITPDGQSVDDASALSRFSNMRRPGVNNRLSDDQTVQSMRDELNKNIVNDNPADNSTKNTGGSSLNGPNGAKSAKPADPNNFSASAKIDAPFESPTPTAIANQSLTSTLSGNGALDNSIKSDQSTTNKLVPPPAEVSTQYGVLADRFQKLQSAGLTDQAINDSFTHQYKQRQAALAAKGGTNVANAGGPMGTGASGGGPLMPASGSKVPTDSGSAPALPDTPAPVQSGGNGVTAPPTLPNPATVAPGTPAVPSVATSGDTGPQIDTSSGMIRPGAPLMITSLAADMKPSRLRDLLTTAEDQMRQQKYTSALDQYDLAERVVPNNPMIALGRANAELGASYYARADNDIRRAFNAGSALMLGQFNLQKFIGANRVTFLVKDLKDIANTEPTSVRAPFLLAYIMYNTGDRKMASNYLAHSEQRAAKPDPLYKQLRVFWDLPDADPLPAAPPAK